MLAITPNFTQNNNQKCNVNFQSKLANTDYLKKTISHAIDQCDGNKVNEGAVDFCKSLKTILNDGKNSILKIDAEPGTVVQAGTPRPQNIFVDGKKVESPETHLGWIYDEYQCESGVNKYARYNCAEDVKVSTLSPLEAKIEKLEAQLAATKEKFNAQLRKQLNQIKEGLVKDDGL